MPMKPNGLSSDAFNPYTVFFLDLIDAYFYSTHWHVFLLEVYSNDTISALIHKYLDILALLIVPTF